MKRLYSILGCAALGAVPVLIAFHFGIAYADTPASSPLDAATGSVTSGMDLIHQYGWLWGSMALVYGGVAALLKRNESEHWLAQGRNLSLVVAGLGLLGAALTAHFAGTAWSGVLLTVIVAAFKLINPMVNAAMLLMTFALATQPACQSAAVKQFASCSESAIIDALKPTVESILENGPPDGEASWVSQLKALAGAYTLAEVNCAVAAVEQALSAKATGSGSSDALQRARSWLSDQGFATAAPKHARAAPTYPRIHGIQMWAAPNHSTVLSMESHSRALELSDGDVVTNTQPGCWNFAKGEPCDGGDVLFNTQPGITQIDGATAIIGVSPTTLGISPRVPWGTGGLPAGDSK